MILKLLGLSIAFMISPDLFWELSKVIASKIIKPVPFWQYRASLVLGLLTITF